MYVQVCREPRLLMTLGPKIQDWDLRLVLTTHFKSNNCRSEILLCIYMSAPCVSLMATPCAGVKWQWDNLVTLPLYLLSCHHFVYCPLFVLTMVMVDCPETAISCTSRVLYNICPDGELWVWICRRYRCWTAGHCALHQRTAEWEWKQIVWL